MAIQQELQNALNIELLNLPSSPPVSEITPENYVDSTGDPSLKIIVTLNQGTEVSEIPGENITQLKTVIRQSLLKHGIEKYPYIFLTLPNESDTTEGES